MKKYIANSDISVSVTLPNKKSTRISFSSLSNGTSVFYTSDKDIQWALEHHYKFGKLFRLVEDSTNEKPSTQKKPNKKQIKTPVPKNGKKADKPVETPAISDDDVSEESCEAAVEVVETGESDNDNETSDDDEVTEYREIVVSDMDDAKDFLAENYDVVRTKLKNEDSIREAALSFGIIFKYL